MTNTLRNTIVLAILLVILGASAFAIFRNLNNKATLLQEENKKTAQKIAVLESQISNIDSLKFEYELRKAMVAEQSKVLLATDTPTTTYQYLLRLQSWMNRTVLFDFAMSDKGNKETSWNEYIVSGRSNYRDVYNLTKHIEYQRAVITLEELAIGSDGVVASDTVSYSLVIRTHFQDGGLDLAQLKAKKMKVQDNFYQLFKTRIYEQLPDYMQADPTLVAIDKSQLIGITSNRIFMRDDQGVIRILATRDKVAFGYLYSIDVAKGKATFIIEKYGIPEEQIMYITPSN